MTAIKILEDGFLKRDTIFLFEDGKFYYRSYKTSPNNRTIEIDELRAMSRLSPHEISSTNINVFKGVMYFGLAVSLGLIGRRVVDASSGKAVVYSLSFGKGQLLRVKSSVDTYSEIQDAFIENASRIDTSSRYISRVS